LQLTQRLGKGMAFTQPNKHYINQGEAYYFALTLILLLTFLRLLLTQSYKAPTMDEPHHIARGLTYFVRGPVVWNGNPPLAHALMAAPLWLDPTLVPTTATLNQLNDFRLLGQAFLQTAQPRWGAAFFVARLPNMLLLIVLLSLVARWARDLWGPRAGMLALLLCAFDPNLLANAQLATTDIAVTVFCLGVGYAAWRFSRTHCWRDALALGVWAGLALTSKYTAFIVLGLIGLTLLFHLVSSSKFSRRTLFSLLSALLTSLLVIWAVYLFHFGTALGVSIALPAPDYIGEFLWQATVNGQNRPSFLAGTLYPSGVMAYFPLAFLLKTPTAAVILLIVALLLMFRHWRKVLIPLTVFIGYFAALTLSPLNIGYRHLLPCLPFAYVLLGVVFSNRRIGKGMAIAYLALTGWALASSLAVFPYDLAYFAEWSGGPARGYQWLSDSSLDWGQDAYAIRDALQPETEPSYVDYFGPTDARALGLPPSTLPTWENDVPTTFHPARPAPGVYAISATYLQGIVFPRDPDALDYFRHLTPEKQIGYSILVYRVPAENWQWAAVCQNADFYLDAATIERLLGSLPRLIHFDCRSSWIAPPGEGVYLLPDKYSPLVGDSNLIYQRAGHWQVYLQRAQPLLPSMPPVTFGEAIQFLGAQSTASNAITSHWQIIAPLTSPTSIFGHRLAADGFELETADGFGFAEAELRPGDVVWQIHRFNEPFGEHDLFSTGIYNWQTGVRWPTPNQNDHLTLPISDLP